MNIENIEERIHINILILREIDFLNKIINN